jgi:hypothetical protein
MDLLFSAFCVRIGLAVSMRPDDGLQGEAAMIKRASIGILAACFLVVAASAAKKRLPWAGRSDIVRKTSGRGVHRMKNEEETE